MKLWKNIDISILDSLPNTAVGYEQRITIPEFTFLGKHNQPDFGSIASVMNSVAKVLNS